MRINKRICLINVTMVLLVCLVGCNAEKSSYDKGIKSLENAEFDAAIDYFTQAGEYEDATDKLLECYYGKGVEAQDVKDYETAIEYFNKAKGYEDSKERISECEHAVAVLQDKTPPVISGLDDKIDVTCGTDFNLNDFIAEKILIEDDVTQNITDYSISCEKVYDRGTGKIDTTIDGEYVVSISSKDEANNVGEKNITLALIPVQVTKDNPNATIYDGEYGVIKVKTFKHGEIYEYSNMYGYYVVFDVENKLDEAMDVYWSMYTSINDYQVTPYYEMISVAPGKKGTAFSYFEDSSIPEEAGNFSQIDAIVCIKTASDEESFFRIPTTFYTNAVQ